MGYSSSISIMAVKLRLFSAAIVMWPLHLDQCNGAIKQLCILLSEYPYDLRCNSCPIADDNFSSCHLYVCLSNLNPPEAVFCGSWHNRNHVFRWQTCWNSSSSISCGNFYSVIHVNGSVRILTTCHVVGYFNNQLIDPKVVYYLKESEKYYS